MGLVAPFAQVSAGLMDVSRAGVLREKGTAPQRLARMRKRGEVVRIRHGAYAEQVDSDELAHHRQLVAGTWPLIGERSVLSHGSAAVLHGLPVWPQSLRRVNLTRAGGGHGRISQHLRVRRAPLAESEIVVRDGLRLTSLERTAVDLARDLDYRCAVAVLDAALRLGGDLGLVAQTVAESRFSAGAGTVRAALAAADGRAESVGESLSRVVLVDAGLALPDLQLNIFDDRGAFVARSDMAWLERGVLGEFDGRVKYTGTPEDVAQVVLAEKQREARLRDLGWVVVRWVWADLKHPNVLRQRIERAFAQARPTAIRGRVARTPIERFAPEVAD